MSLAAFPEPIPKPDTPCRTCLGWQWSQVGYMPHAIGGEQHWNGVLLVGEALGEQEALHGKPFVGRAGLALDQMLQRYGMRREHFLIDNTLRCFLSWRVSIRTAEGYKSWSSVNVGDQVLTHNGRFRPITAKHRVRFSGTVFHVRLSDDTQQAVTEDHGWFTPSGLVLAQDLRAGMSVLGVTEACLECGTHFHRCFQREAGGSLPFCTMTCLNRWVTTRSRDAVAASMRAQYADGRRDRWTITKAANAEMRRRVSAGDWEAPIVTPERRLQSRVAAALARQARGLGEDVWIGHGEEAVHDILVAAGYEPVPQFALGSFNYDFRVGNVLIEVDNPVRASQCVVRARQREKDEAAAAEGLEVLHIPSTQPEVVLDRLRNHDGDFQFRPVEVTGIVENQLDDRFTYSLEVAEDASHVVMGIAHHNCRPPGNKLAGEPYEQEVITHCAQHLDRTIAERRPRVLVPLGDVALRRLLGVSSLAKKEKLTDRRGFPEWSGRYGCWIVPAFHPSYIMRGNRHLTPVFAGDLRKAERIAREGFTPFRVRLLSDPSLDTLESFVNRLERLVDAGVDCSLAFDIETPYKAEEGDDEASLELDDPSYIITRIGFAYTEDEAVSVRWAPETLPYIKRLLEASCHKLTWNGRYDTPRVIANGVRPGGAEWDLMWAWHIWRSDQPKRLSFVASCLLLDATRWKNLARIDEGKYNALDALITKRLERLIIDGLRGTEQWPVFERHVLRLDSILMAMTAKGLQLDTAARAEYSRVFAANLESIRQEAEALIPRNARRAFIYTAKAKPKDLIGLVRETHETKVKVCPNCGALDPKKPHFKTFKRKENPCAGLVPDVRFLPVERWVRLEPFVPSNAQLGAYLKAQEHVPVLAHKTRQPTFNEEAIRVLLARYPEDPLYERVLDYREVETTLARYLGWPDASAPFGVVGGMAADSTGRVHGVFLHNPRTLRLSMTTPSLHNLPRGDDSAVQASVRKIIIADPGEVFIELDFRGIEAVLVGYEAMSLRYIRLAKLGVHDFLNAHILAHTRKIAHSDIPDLKWSDADLKGAFKDLKRRFPIERNTAKRVVHLSNYLGTPRRMRDLYPKEFESVAAAAALQDLYFSVCPEVRQWHSRLIESADNGASARNVYGYVHYFFAIKDWFKHENKWEWRLGDDAKALVAFKPQSTAAGIIKEAMLRIEEAQLASYLRLQVHDSLLLAGRSPAIEEVAARVASIMEQPIPQLPLAPLGGTGYLSIDVEAKRGTCWGDCQEFELPRGGDEVAPAGATGEAA